MTKHIKRALLALAVASVITTEAVRLSDLSPASAAEYNRSCSVTGGSAQSLSSVLSTCGYSGAVSLQELTIRNPDSAANTLYIGQSDANASNSFPLAPGESITWRASNQGDLIDAGRLYLYVSSTQNAALSLRSK
ncbi:MAG TPA: hypothetical protein VF659_24230 [Pyrinomonadaceae bacterium]